MLPLLFALALATAPPVAPPLRTLDDVLALARAGVPEREVSERVRASGIYVPITPEWAARLYLDDGVSALVLGALFASSGSPWPRVTGRPGELELLYDGYRIVGRHGASGNICYDPLRMQKGVYTQPHFGKRRKGRRSFQFLYADCPAADL